MKPIILVTTSLDTGDKRFNRINRDYCRAIISMGGIPLIIDYALINNLDILLNMADGVLLTGGGDIHAKYFNEPLHEKADFVVEERDEFEISLFLGAFERDMPVLGICRGAQVINVALGGNIIQHIENHSHYDKRFEPVHSIDIAEDSLLFDITGMRKIKVNSAHHQIVGRNAHGIKISACSEDGIIEAIEHRDKRFILGVQWHPELLYENHLVQARLFERFLYECNLIP